MTRADALRCMTRVLTRVPARSLAGGPSDFGNGGIAAGSGPRTRIPPRTSSARWRAAHLAEREAAWSPDASTPFVCLFVWKIVHLTLDLLAVELLKP